MSAIQKEVTIGDCRMILGDCLQVMPELGRFDAVVTDPPYGIGAVKKDHFGGRGSRPTRTRLGTSCPERTYKISDWDKDINEGAIVGAISRSEFQIIFGGNYYNLPPTSCWLVWDKQNTGEFADCELAWTNMPKAVRRIYWRWNGMIRKGSDVRVHPTQKPVGVMEWCIGHLPDSTETILDPFMGSGTTGVACVKLGRKFTGIELDPDYFEIACERIRKAYAQPDLFVEAEKAPAPVQEGMDL